MSYSNPKSELSSSDFFQKNSVNSVLGVYQQKTWVVSTTPSFSIYVHFTSITDALASTSVKPGDRILLYSSADVIDASTAIVIDKDITIEGAAGYNSISIGSGSPTMMFDLQANNVYLKNLAFILSPGSSSVSAVSTSGGTRVNLFCENCIFQAPVVLYPSGNNIQFVGCTFLKNSTLSTSIPIQFQSYGYEADGGNGQIINIESCTFQDSSSNSSAAIQVTFLAGVTHPISVTGCSYTGGVPHNALLKIIAGSTADSNVKMPVWVRSNNIGTGNILLQVVAGVATTPLLLDNFSYIRVSGNTISNTSGYGFVTCDRTGTSPAKINLGTVPLLFASGNTSTNPTTVRSGYSTGTSEGSTVLLTYNNTRFNAYSQSEISTDLEYIRIPDPVPASTYLLRVDSTSFNVETYDKILIPTSWNQKFTGIYIYPPTYVPFACSLVKIASPSDLKDGSIIIPKQGNDYDKTIWISSGDTITKLSEKLPFESGSDGDVEITGSTTLISDMYYRNLTVSGTINTGGFRIYVSESLTISKGGIIRMIGASGSGRSAGIGFSSLGTLGISSGSGGDGGFGGAAVSPGSAGSSPSGSVVTPYFTGVATTTYEGGVGSTGGLAGGAAGTVSSAIQFNGGFDNQIDSQAGFSTRTGSSFSGGAGGGGGGGHSSSGNNGGGGGAGGGGIWISARHIYNSGLISANGGNGGNGVGSGGGGAGGGGGWVYVQYSSGDPGNCTARGGRVGAGGTASIAARDGKVTLKII